MYLKHIIIAFAVTFCLLLSIIVMLLAHRDDATGDVRKAAHGNARSARHHAARNAAVPQFDIDKSHTADAAPAARDASSLRQAHSKWSSDEPKAVILMADSDEKFRKLLETLAAHGISDLRIIPALRTVSAKLTDSEKARIAAEFDGLTAEDDSVVFAPDSMNFAHSGNAIPFNRSLLPWLGMDASSQNRGEGVLIAVLDQPVTPTATTRDANVKLLDLFGLAERCEAEGASPEHGNAVMSILAADSDVLKGIVPNANYLSIPVLDSNGTGSTFQLAEAIIAAADQGADIISISLGTDTPSTLLQFAVNYATEAGAVIVAAVGNDARNGVLYPAACQNTIAVTACDAASNAADFANYGDAVDIAAPGIGLAVDYSDASNGEYLNSFSGTSAAAPCVTGAIAALMTENPQLSAAQAAKIIIDSAMDNGAPGQDVQYGSGVLNYTRAAHWHDSGYSDAAAAGIFMDLQNANDISTPLVISAQNTGNTSIPSIKLDYSVNGKPYTETFSNVAPGETVSITHQVPNQERSSVDVQSIVSSEHVQDMTQTNNEKRIRLSVTPSKDSTSGY